jgi:hypothetical protein
MIRRAGDITLTSPPDRSRIVGTKETIQKVKNRLRRKKRVSTRKLSMELDISDGTVRRILKNDLGLRSYRKQFANSVRTNFRKQETLKILFSDEKYFYIDGVCNSQKDRVWAVDRADQKGGIKQKRKLPQKVMVWLGACSKGITPLIIMLAVSKKCFL